jgi:hypothetical protein
MIIPLHAKRLADLLERVESGNHALTADIYEALGYEVIRAPRSPRGIAWRYRGHGHFGFEDRWISMEMLSTSIDKARRISNWLLLHMSDIGADGLPLVELGDCDANKVVGIARDLPLSYCAAALRAVAFDVEYGVPMHSKANLIARRSGSAVGRVAAPGSSLHRN